MPKAPVSTPSSHHSSDGTLDGSTTFASFAHSALEGPSREELRPLLALNDKLRKLTKLETDINATTIVALGDQSHGKSSVIEALSGLDLPRGEDIVTRLPLVLYLKERDSGDSDYATIKADGIESRVVQLEDIAESVRQMTDLVAGDKKNVLDKEIELTVYKQDQDELTLIDLPGLTRVAEKTQAENIEEVIRAMYERYIRTEEAVLMNVVSAMVDVSTSASLKMSLAHDPQATRTLLCFTKLDQYKDSGLKEKVEQVGQKFDIPEENVFCVRNRSKAENEEGVSLQKARELEESFFFCHNELRELPVGMMGAMGLGKRLVAIQRERILETLPKNTETIMERLEELQKEHSLFAYFPKKIYEAYLILNKNMEEGFRQIEYQRTGKAEGSSCDTELKSEEFTLTSAQPRFDSNIAESIFELQHNLPKGEWTITPKEKEKALDILWEAWCFAENGSGNYSPKGRKISKSKKGSFIFDDETTSFQIRMKVFVATKSYIFLCSRFEREKNRFVEELRSIAPISRFSSSEFISTFQFQLDRRKGCEGLPGTVPVDEALRVVERFLKDGFPAAENFVTRVHQLMEQEVSGAMKRTFVQCGRLHMQIQSLFQERFRDLLETVHEAVKWEKEKEFEIDTVDESFNDDMKTLWKEVDEENENDDDLLESLADKQILKGLKESEPETFDQVLRMFCYWRRVSTRFVDNVILTVRRLLISKEADEKNKEWILSELYGMEDKLLMLMSPEPKVQKKMKNIEERIKELMKARDEIHGVMGIRRSSSCSHSPKSAVSAKRTNDLKENAVARNRI